MVRHHGGVVSSALPTAEQSGPARRMLGNGGGKAQHMVDFFSLISGCISQFWQVQVISRPQHTATYVFFLQHMVYLFLLVLMLVAMASAGQESCDVTYNVDI